MYTEFKINDIILVSSPDYGIERFRARVTFVHSHINLNNNNVVEVEPLDAIFPHDNFIGNKRHCIIYTDIIHGLYYKSTELPEELFII